MTSATITVFESAMGLAKQAVHQDKAKNYSEAARCYKESIETFEIVKSKSGHWTLDSVRANVKQLSMSGAKNLCKRRILNTYLRQQ